MGKSIPTILVEDRYWIPAKHVDIDKAERLYRVQVFDEKLCSRCEYKAERVCDVCLECEGFEGDYKLYKEKEINDRPYIGVPIGNRRKLKRLVRISRFKFRDKRSPGRSFAKLGLKFYRKKLYKYQLKATSKLRGRSGVLKSAPRTGKTVMAVEVVLNDQVKTLIFAHQEDLLKQFLGTFRNPELTNILGKEQFDGREYVKICRTYEDFKKYPICLATYQTFISKGGKKLLKKVVELPFGRIIVDEVHRANANCFSTVINAFKTKKRSGLTATPKRKDGKHFIVRDIIGPIIHETKAKPMPLRVDVVETGLHTNRNYRIWAFAMRFLEKDAKRTKLIVKTAVQDLKKGRSIVIPVTTQNHADNLTRLINRAYGKPIAHKFTGTLSKTVKNNLREKVLVKARKGKYRCIVAMRSMLTGVNVPKWDTIYEIVPISNEPNLEQELLRVCTPDEGKKSPLVRWFVDDFSISRACFAASVTHMKNMRKRLGGFKYTKRGAELTKKHLAVYYGAKSRRRAAEDYDDPKPYRADDKGEPVGRRAKSSAKSPWKPIAF